MEKANALLPDLAVLIYGVKYQIGLCQAAQTKVYVNRGLGVINPPIRFRCPPEITYLTLSPA